MQVENYHCLDRSFLATNPNGNRIKPIVLKKYKDCQCPAERNLFGVFIAGHWAINDTSFQPTHKRLRKGEFR